MGLLFVLLPPYHASPLVLTLAVLLFVLVLAMFWWSTTKPERTWRDPAVGYLMFVFVALVRDAAGGSTSGMSILLVVPILWLAITGSRRELKVAGLVAALVVLGPMLVFGAPNYPLSDWTRAVGLFALSFIIGPVLQGIVARLAHETRLERVVTERYERLFLDAPHGAVLLDDTGRIVRTNGAMGAIMGMAPDDLAGRMLVDLAPPSHGAIEDHLSRMIDDGALTSASDCMVRDATGTDVYVALSSRMWSSDDDDDEPGSIMINVVDVSERHRYQDRLNHLVDHDILSGLANRRRFDSELQRHVERTRRYGHTGAVLLMDLDNFKRVNDSLGHNAGDELLVSIGSLLRRVVRDTDVVARLGGDEFGILLTDGDQDAAERVGNEVVARVRAHAATLDGVRRRVTVSVGAVTFRAAAEHTGDILALADMTMYDAKEAGRDQLALLPEGESRPPRFAARLQWQSRIEEALEHNRFELHLQPIMDLKTNQVCSAEVLLRLRDEDELVPPSRFLYIAERVGLMPRIDAWVIGRSVAMLAELRKRSPGFQLEVNLSGHSIGHPNIEVAIADALTRHEVEPGALILEMTETAAVADVGLAREFAERMTALGCRFALDDFGAGFGSFYYLKHLLFDFVKIDGEFISNVHRSKVDRTIMRSIVGIAHDLGKRTVAEFVSDEEILEVVRAEGVDLAQGYWIGKPAPYEEFVRDFVSGPCT